MDINNVIFNPNHEIEASAKDAATGMRLLVLAFLANFSILALSIFGAISENSGSIMDLSVTALYILSFAAGAYGAYLSASALGWSGFITTAVVLSAIIPLLKFICFIVLISFSINLIRKAGYKTSLIGQLRKRAVA